MCGIAGAIGPFTPELLAAVRQMSARLGHRGPDANGFWTSPDGRVAFGHGRLAIIDLSDDGRQPMTDPETWTRRVEWPGHARPRPRRPQRARAWNWSPSDSFVRPSTDTEPVRAALEEPVRQHLISDVPLGVSSRAPGASPGNSAPNTTARFGFVPVSVSTTSRNSALCESYIRNETGARIRICQTTSRPRCRSVTDVGSRAQGSVRMSLCLIMKCVQQTFVVPVGA
jgi:hypothetical protein